MTNVLPIEAQKRVWRIYRARLLLACALFLMTLALFGALALIPSYLALHAAAPPSLAPSEKKEAGPDDPTAIVHTQTLIGHILPVLSATSSPSSVLKEALAARGQGVVIDRISYTAGQITLGGSAPRDSLTRYRDALTQMSRFTGVSLPVGALVGNEGNRFSLTLTGNF